MSIPTQTGMMLRKLHRTDTVKLHIFIKISMAKVSPHVLDGIYWRRQHSRQHLTKYANMHATIVTAAMLFRVHIENLCFV